MGAIVSAILAAIPKAILAVIGKLVTETFMEKVLVKVMVYGLEKLAKNTQSPLDDSVVKDIKAQMGVG